MYIRKTRRQFKGKTYLNHLLVESVQTPHGPRQRTICSLGSLEPAPAEDWLGLAHKIESALEGQASLGAVAAEVERLSRRAVRGKKSTAASDSTVTIEVDQVEIEEAREAGPVHVGHQMWRQLGLDAILGRAGLSPRVCTLTEAMTLNRLICPRSEHAMPDWIRRTALGELLEEDFSTLGDEALYRNLDRLHPQREGIERELAEREKSLFNLDDSIFLYDLTSTYFEGEALANAQAKRGYSRDKRPDCKQVVVGLVLDREGFPKAHEVFDGNTQDRKSLDRMLEVLEKRTGKRPGATVIVDRGMAYEENLEQIQNRGQSLLGGGTARGAKPVAGGVGKRGGLGRDRAYALAAESLSEEDPRRDQAPAKRRGGLHPLPQRRPGREGSGHSRKTASEVAGGCGQASAAGQ